MASFARDRNYDRSGHENHYFNSSRDYQSKETRALLKRLVARLNRRLGRTAIRENTETA